MFDTTISLWRHKCFWEKPQRYVDENWEYRENAVTTTAFHGLTSNDDHQLHKMACSSSVRPYFVASPPWAFKPYDHTGMGCCRMQRFGPRNPKSVQNYHCSVSVRACFEKDKKVLQTSVCLKRSHTCLGSALIIKNFWAATVKSSVELLVGAHLPIQKVTHRHSICFGRKHLHKKIPNNSLWKLEREENSLLDFNICRPTFA